MRHASSAGVFLLAAVMGLLMSGCSSQKRPDAGSIGRAGQYTQAQQGKGGVNPLVSGGRSGAQAVPAGGGMGGMMGGAMGGRPAGVPGGPGGMGGPPAGVPGMGGPPPGVPGMGGPPPGVPGR